MGMKHFGLLLLILCSACAGRTQMATSPATVQTDSAVLTQSLFARDPAGQLTAAAIQTILRSPLELGLPARAGALPIIPAEDWHGPGPSYEMASAGLSKFADRLPSAELFTLVTEMMPIPSGALGMEALREIAARYKLRYIVLYRENVRRQVRNNAWTIGYATVIGSLFLPGSTLKVDGYVEASLFDIKTGLLLFTVRQRVAARQRSNVWHQGDKLETMQAKLALTIAGKLAHEVRKSLLSYARATAKENETGGNGSVATSTPPPPEPIATTE